MARGVSRAIPVARRLERIEIGTASVRLGRHWVLRDVSLDIRAGERWLLLGPNGAGKTVLLKLLRGDIWPTPTGRATRRYHLCDGEVLEQPLFAADRIAYLGPERQDRYVRYESTLDVAQVVLTGFDDADFPLHAATPAQRRRIEIVLRQVGLAGYASRKFLTLSYGQRRRVLLARAFVREPDVLLLDEALNGLDAQARGAFLRALWLVSSPRTAWVLTSHRRSDAPAGLTHLARMAHGVIDSVSNLHAGAVDAAATLAAARTLSRPEPRPEERAGVVQASKHRTHAADADGRIRATRPLLRLQRAAVYRDERVVVGRCDWTLERGQHWVLRGANGSGKSTFVAMLYGDLWPAHDGTRVREWPAADDWKARVGLVSPELQARYAATGCTVEQIVASGFHASIGLNDRPTVAELRRVRRELRAWGLADFATRQARELSYGQLRLALVARAFVRARRLWLLDEPFDGLDALARQRLRARLDEAVAKGATVVLATHHEEDVPDYVKRVLTLRRGRAPVISER